jgi:hypothetical protein
VYGTNGTRPPVQRRSPHRPPGLSGRQSWPRLVDNQDLPRREVVHPALGRPSPHSRNVGRRSLWEGYVIYLMVTGYGPYPLRSGLDAQPPGQHTDIVADRQRRARRQVVDDQPGGRAPPHGVHPFVAGQQQ